MPCTDACVAPTPAQCHCSACHETFSGITLFDRHRRNGECRRPGDLGIELRRIRGVWRYAEPRPSFGAKEPADAA
jgi:hypothetical protein